MNRRLYFIYAATSFVAAYFWCGAAGLIGAAISLRAEEVYDARISGREILTPSLSAEPLITGATIFGVRPGSQIRFHVSATGEKPVEFSATGLPAGVAIDPISGWITGRAPQQAGNVVAVLTARNAKGHDTRELTLRVGDTICLTPPMGWNSWYVHSEGVSEKAIREMADAMQGKGLTDHGWTYLNIDDCWMGLRDPATKTIHANAKFGDMKALVEFVNGKGLKLGLYSTPWMSTYAGYVGGTAPNEEGDYSEFFLADAQRQNPHQVFGRYPNGIRKGLARVGPVWFVDRDARQFADWGIDYVKYDWKEWTLVKTDVGFQPRKDKPEEKSEAVTKRVHDNFRALDRDIVISLSPDHSDQEAGFVTKYCNLWRLTPDIHAEWKRMIAPFQMEKRLRLTRPGCYGDLDMLQIGPLGKPNRAEIDFKPSPLSASEQYFQVTLWSILTQPLLLSCNVPTMDAFDLNLVSNDEVLAVNQDPSCKQGYRVANLEGEWEIWAKDLVDGGKAVAMFNLSNEDRVLAVTKDQLGLSGRVRDLWRQKDIGPMDKTFSAKISPHGIVFVTVKTDFSEPRRLLSSAPIQTVRLKGDAGGKRFDGIGLVNGGGATSVLLKDYPEPQRSQILDLVYKPKFGASVSALLVEIPGDGNSTQGSMPSHMRTPNDLDYTRGYMWWVLREVKKRNPNITLDGTAWSAPDWVGGGKFWSQDAADYYVKWLQGLRDVYGLEFAALGCRNEKGVSAEFAQMLRAALDANGFGKVKLHAFDNWPDNKFDFVVPMLADEKLRGSIDVIGAHVLYGKPNAHASKEVQAMAAQMSKPIWNTEDHVYKKGFDCAISIVECFNDNFIRSGATKIVNWYDIAGVYAMEPYAEDPATVLAREPWSGHYQVREALWGYAHYGQFTEVGWEYLNGGCGDLGGGGTFVTMKSPANDYSIIIETKEARAAQQVRFEVSGGLSARKLCVWRSNAQEQFMKQASVEPVGGAFTLTLDPDSIYSLSTTTGQQKGVFEASPAPQAFPFPYAENFESYNSPKDYGHLPRYFADIEEVFELVSRPDGKGRALRQVIPVWPISWAPSWQPYTILGDEHWQDYEVSVDVCLNAGDTAGVMGRVNHVGTGYGTIPKGYFLQLRDDGKCDLVVVRGKKDKKKLTGDAEQQALLKKLNDESEGGEKILATTQVPDIRAGEWHNLMIRLEGATLTSFVDGKEVLKVTDTLYTRGMAGLVATARENKKLSMPYYDNFVVKAVGAAVAMPPTFTSVPNYIPIYQTSGSRK